MSTICICSIWKFGLSVMNVKSVFAYTGGVYPVDKAKYQLCRLDEI